MCSREIIGQGFTILVVIGLGTAFGMLLEPDRNLPYPYRYGSAVLGWTYFFAWSISFYPQIYHNFKRKTSSGLSVDFLLFNALGYMCYSIFTVSMYYIPEFRLMYEQRHQGNLIQVSISDVCFAVHALVLTILTWAQVIYYDGHHQIPSNTAFLSGFWFVVAAAAYVLFITQHFNNNRDPWNWYTFIYVIAMTKVVVTLVKYPPQILANYRLKSTIGFSITQIILDLMGSALSLTQLVLDCYFSGPDWSGLLGNPVKLFLAGISIIYDLILIYQHYIQYPSRVMVPPPEFSSSLSLGNSYANTRAGRGDSVTFYTTIQNAIEHNDDVTNQENMDQITQIEMQRQDKKVVANWNSNSPASNPGGLSKYNYSLPGKFRNPKSSTHDSLPENDDDGLL